MEDIAYKVLAETENTHWWSLGRREIFRSTLNSLNLPKNAAILEVGAGTGGNIGLLKEFGQVTALEGNPNGLEKLEKIKNIELINGYITNTTSLGNRNFDLIVLFDVLEHIEHDINTLKLLKGHLSKKGKILLSVPANEWLWSNHDVVNHHFRRYSKKHLEETIIQANLNPSRITHFNTILFPVIAAVRLINNIIKRKNFDQEKLPKKPINNLLRAIFSSERFLLNSCNIPFGVSLLAIAEPVADEHMNVLHVPAATKTTKQ